MENAEIRFYGNKWCPDCRRARILLEKFEVPFHFTDVDSDPEAKKIVMETNHGFCSVPTIFFPDGSSLTEPSNLMLEQKILQLRADGLI